MHRGSVDGKGHRSEDVYDHGVSSTLLLGPIEALSFEVSVEEVHQLDEIWKLTPDASSLNLCIRRSYDPDLSDQFNAIQEVLGPRKKLTPLPKLRNLEVIFFGIKGGEELRSAIEGLLIRRRKEAVELILTTFLETPLQNEILKKVSFRAKSTARFI